MNSHELVKRRTGSSLEALLAVVVDTTDEAVVTVDEDQQIIFFNKGAEKIFGYAAPEALGQPIDLLIPPRWRGTHRSQIKRFAQEPETSRLMGERQEISCLRRDGSEFPSLASITKVHVGNARMFTAILRDISVQKRILSQFEIVTNAMSAYLARRDWQEASRVLLRGALNQTQSEYGFAGVVTAGSVLRILAHEGIVWDQSENRGFYENALRTYREQGYLEFTNLNNLFGQVITTGQTVLSNEPASDSRAGGCPPGHPPLRCFLGVPIPSGTNVVGMIGVANRPGGYTRQDQAALEILAQPAGVLYDSYRWQERETSLQEQLRQSQKMEAIGQLAGGIAHDFNNILTVILGCTEVLLTELGAGDPRCGDVEQIKRAGTRAADLVRQLLAFSRRQVLRPRRLNLNDVVTGAHAMLHRLIGEHIEVTTVLDPAIGTIVADAGQLEQILTNLVVNARDAMATGGRLTMKTANVNPGDADAQHHVQLQSRPWVRLVVSDTGHGMDTQTKSRIFEPFFTTKERGKGTGLGLSTVYGVVKQSEGFIWVDSEPGLGTTFRIYLPRVEGTAEQIDHPENTARELSGSEVVLPSRTWSCLR